ncbi:pyridoxamine 5'-phosphate oxidase family protein [Lysinibacillus sp. KU-BSD001]|uniref:pyridoxamine 5'-phosphate oxidase family protein n=1 Tax=Lysinibacillus sp. KU-BSD001 TaxID=3141328 RepID=UPI0036EC3DBA
MNNSLRDQALDILSKHSVGVMATVSNGKPDSRYMTFSNDGFTLYTVTPKDSGKLDELRKNSHTHILYGYENEELGETFLEIEGKVLESNIDEMKERILSNYKGDYLGDASSLVLLKVEPERLRFMNKSGDNREEINFH